MAGASSTRRIRVRFTARELWGESGSDVDTVHVDLWERYLEEMR